MVNSDSNMQKLHYPFNLKVNNKQRTFGSLLEKTSAPIGHCSALSVGEGNERYEQDFPVLLHSLKHEKNMKFINMPLSEFAIFLIKIICR